MSVVLDDQTIVPMLKQMAMTHRRATRQFNHYAQNLNKSNEYFFLLYNDELDYDLRKESIDYLSKYAIDGIAVWWVSVGESREQIQDITSFCWSRNSLKNVPRYLMGIGDSRDN
jgi:queuine tRNA-ribosyltransferase